MSLRGQNLEAKKHDGAVNIIPRGSGREEKVTEKSILVLGCKSIPEQQTALQAPSLIFKKSIPCCCAGEELLFCSKCQILFPRCIYHRTSLTVASCESCVWEFFSIGTLSLLALVERNTGVKKLQLSWSRLEAEV